MQLLGGEIPIPELAPSLRKPAKVVAALLEARVLVERGAGRGQEHGVPGNGQSGGPAEGRVQVPDPLHLQVAGPVAPDALLDAPGSVPLEERNAGVISHDAGQLVEGDALGAAAGQQDDVGAECLEGAAGGIGGGGLGVVDEAHAAVIPHALLTMG